MTFTQPKPNSGHKPDSSCKDSKATANPLIQRLIQPQMVANWSLDENGQVVCHWENRPSKRPHQR